MHRWKTALLIFSFVLAHSARAVSDDEIFFKLYEQFPAKDPQVQAKIIQAVKLQLAIDSDWDEPKAETLFLEAAKTQDPAAIRSLARFYQLRRIWPKRAKAGELYKVAMEKGDPWAMSNYAYFYERNPAKTRALLLKASELNFPQAMVNYGDCFAEGTCEKKSMADAVIWYKKASDLGHWTGTMHLYRAYFNGGAYFPADQKQALALLQGLADAGNKNAIEVLGDVYITGRFGTQDIPKGIELYEKAFALGNRNAYAQLYGELTKDDNPHRDCALGLRYLNAGAETGDRASNSLLGSVYERGICNTPINLTLAGQYYAVAAKKGDVDSILSTGLMYDHGYDGGGGFDSEKTMAYYLKAAMMRDQDGMNNVGTMYHHGKGKFKQDLAKAYAWFAAAQQAGEGSGVAERNLRDTQKEMGFLDRMRTVKEMREVNATVYGPPENAEQSVEFSISRLFFGLNLIYVNLAAFALYLLATAMYIFGQRRPVLHSSLWIIAFLLIDLFPVSALMPSRSIASDIGIIRYFSWAAVAVYLVVMLVVWRVMRGDFIWGIKTKSLKAAFQFAFAKNGIDAKEELSGYKISESDYLFVVHRPWMGGAQVRFSNKRMAPKMKPVLADVVAYYKENQVGMNYFVPGISFFFAAVAGTGIVGTIYYFSLIYGRAFY